MISTNRPFRSLIVLAAIAMPALADPAIAQSGFGTRLTAGVLGGATFPRGAFDDEVGYGWHAGAFGKIRLYGPLDGRIDGAYAKFGKKELVATGGALTTEAYVTFGTASVSINLGADSAAYPGDNTVSPYLLGGLGRYSLDFEAECIQGTCGTIPEVKTFWGVNVGGGATVPLAGIRTFVEGRYHRISRAEVEGGARVMVLLSVGVKFR
ncbi:MAG TPA: hypothetical protein VHM24_00475 [Gemmatimonadaceae bacterium]|nr:hypothetical protein [Gemmatimonadaceae bacterium]